MFLADMKFNLNKGNVEMQTTKLRNPEFYVRKSLIFLETYF